MEYKTRQWHEKCFSCCVCKTPIGTKSFIPREQEIYCAGCYEEKYATRCIKCNLVSTIRIKIIDATKIGTIIFFSYIYRSSRPVVLRTRTNHGIANALHAPNVRRLWLANVSPVVTKNPTVPNASVNCSPNDALLALSQSPVSAK